jgi:hypothetical protein
MVTNVQPSFIRRDMARDDVSELQQSIVPLAEYEHHRARRYDLAASPGKPGDEFVIAFG